MEKSACSQEGKPQMEEFRVVYGKERETRNISKDDCDRQRAARMARGSWAPPRSVSGRVKHELGMRGGISGREGKADERSA